MSKLTKLIIIISTILLLVISFTIGTFHVIDRVKLENNKRLIQEYYDNKVMIFKEENKTLNNVDVVFCGDSITDGCDLSKYYPDINAVNRGIGGDTTTGVLKRMNESFYDVNPKVIVLLIGGNNIYKMFDDYEDILKGLSTNLPNTKVILLSLTAMKDSFKDKNQIAMENNEVIKSLATKYGYTYVDIFTAMYDTNTNACKEELLNDPVHPNEAGYELISSIVTPVINELLEEK